MKDDIENRPEKFTLEDFIPYRLAVVAKSVSTAFSKTYAERFGITIPQWRVLAAIGREPHCTASGIVEHAGLVTSQPDEKDRRNSVLSFTSEGRAIYDQVVPAGRAFEEKLMSVMSEKYLTDLERLLDKLSQQAKQL